jgi:hypothetical protein
MTRTLVPVVATLLLAACSDVLGPGEAELTVLRQRLKNAEQRWHANGPESYTVTVQRLCYCAEIDPRQVTVIDGVVTDVRIVGAAAPIPPDQWRWYPSVEGLFAIIREAIDEPAYELELEFSDTLGYALRVEIDWDAFTADEEVTFVVSSLVTY